VDALRVGVPVPAARAAADRFPLRYRPVRALKRGNGVETWLVTDTERSSPAVLKSVDLESVHAAARLRFQHEAQVLRELAGKGLPGLIDAGRTVDRLYLVQPYVVGRTLEQRLGDGPLPLLEALRVAAEIAASLDVAHGAGVVHRDVKPANVVLGDDGSVALIDFGFARSPWLDAAIRDELVGTVRYLAPEAAGLLEAPVDERSDLYALGVLLYEAVSGRAPFTGPSVGDVLRQHLSARVPALAPSDATVPRALDSVLERLLRKDPAERYQSAAALASDLLALRAALAAETPTRAWCSAGSTSGAASPTPPSSAARPSSTP
jgi:serine/threonine protein kinase